MARQASAAPPGLVVGIWLSVASVVVSSLGGGFCEENPLQWMVVSVAGTIAGAWLAATGALELSRRLVGRRARAAQISAAGFALIALVSILDVLIVFGVANIDQITRWDGVFPYVFLAGFALAGIGLAIAGPSRGAVLFAAAIAVLSLFEARLLVEKLFVGLLSGRHMLVFAVFAAALWGGLAYVLARRAAADAAEAPLDQTGAIAGLRRAGAGLWIRLGATSLLAALIGIKVASVERFVMVTSPIAGAIAMVIFATALVRVASASGTELPRRALHVAAFFALWTAVQETIQAFYVYNAFARSEDLGTRFLATPAWPQATLVTAAVSIAILLWAIERMAKAAGDDVLARNTATANKVFIIFMTIRTLIVIGTGMNDRSLAVLIANPLAIGALVLAAALCGKAATTIEKRPGLATATLRAPDRS